MIPQPIHIRACLGIDGTVEYWPYYSDFDDLGPALNPEDAIDLITRCQVPIEIAACDSTGVNYESLIPKNFGETDTTFRLKMDS